MRKNEKGITLIALVVTIIVLLILAGVSIAMLTGENGIMGRARESSWKTKLGDAEDIVTLEVSSEIASYYAKAYADQEIDGQDNLQAAIKQGCDNAQKQLNGGTKDKNDTPNYTITSTIDDPTAKNGGTIKVVYKANKTDSYEVTGTLGAGSSRVSWSAMTVVGVTP